VYSGDVVGAIRRLNGMLGRTGVKKHVRRGEYYEMPSEKRRRVASERHRRRFQEMVSFILWSLG
jgi:ribosomal protein S21